MSGTKTELQGVEGGKMSAIVKHTRDAVCEVAVYEVVVWMLQAAGGSGWGSGLLTNDRPVGVACVARGVEGVRVPTAG